MSQFHKTKSLAKCTKTVIKTIIKIRPIVSKINGLAQRISWLLANALNPLTPEDFHVFERFSAFTRPIGFRDSIFKVTMESAAVPKH